MKGKICKVMFRFLSLNNQFLFHTLYHSLSICMCQWLIKYNVHHSLDILLFFVPYLWQSLWWSKTIHEGARHYVQWRLKVVRYINVKHYVWSRYQQSPETYWVADRKRAYITKTVKKRNLVILLMINSLMH